MPATDPVPFWQWAAFIGAILVYVLLDLFVFHRGAKPVTFKNALFWTGVTVFLALGFGAALVPWRGKEEALEFTTGYIIELSLSMDNVFIIALIFSYFQVPVEYQHRVLFFGFINALIMRGTAIALGAVLVSKFYWILYVMGGVLLITGVKMLFSKEEGVHPEKNPIIRLARRMFPVSANYDGAHFFTRIDGRFALTPLVLVLLMVETTDLVFAVDSIPAIFSVTQKPFIIFTSNIFAILGLRSLYFVLVSAMKYFRYLKIGLAFVLVFVAVKMLIDPHGGPPKWFQFKIPITISLLTVVGIILLSIVASLVAARRDQEPVVAVPVGDGKDNPSPRDERG